jgi:16S rRNA (guanine527-N7)-methyltransferase
MPPGASAGSDAAAPDFDPSMDLATGAAALGLVLPASVLVALEQYLDLLERWGRTYNLTAIRDRAAMRVLHVLDSLAVVAPLERWRAGHPGDAGRRPLLLDVGSGAGLPGVVVAIAAPAWQVACVDTVGKKAGFIRQVGAELRLPHLHAFHARVEALPADRAWQALAPEGADVVTSRAFASLADFLAATAAVRAPAGAWMALKGQVPEAEIAEACLRDPALGPPFVESLSVPGLSARRCLVWWPPGQGQPSPVGGADAE